MVKLKKDIHINAPVEEVFDFLTEPTNLPEIWPSMLKVKNVKSSTTKGNDFDWEYKMAGMAFQGHSDTLEYEPNKHVVIENKDGIPSKFVWDYKPENGGMHLKLNVEYTVPVPLLGKLAEKVILKINENEMDLMLANLKVALEY